jgi:hypothetical protein
VSHASPFLLPPALTSSHPQPSVAAPHNIRDHSADAVLPYTNLVAHILTQKTWITNHNKIYPKAVQEDTVDGSVSSMPGPSRDDLVVLSTYRCRTHSTLSWLSQESNPVTLSNIFTHLLLSFVHHYLPKLITFSLNVLKKFLTTLECLLVTHSCMLSIERFNRNHRNQCRYKPHITVSFIWTHPCIILTNNIITNVAIPKFGWHHSLSSWYTTLT